MSTCHTGNVKSVLTCSRNLHNYEINGGSFEQVLKNIHWTIREGDKWHLQGGNGQSDSILQTRRLHSYDIWKARVKPPSSPSSLATTHNHTRNVLPPHS